MTQDTDKQNSKSSTIESTLTNTIVVSTKGLTVTVDCSHDLFNSLVTATIFNRDNDIRSLVLQAVTDDFCTSETCCDCEGDSSSLSPCKGKHSTTVIKKVCFPYLDGNDGGLTS